jgi:hypothetical protein
MPKGIYKHKGHPITEETKIKLSGKNSHKWKGGNVGYCALHFWNRRHFGKANKCENPDCKYVNPKRYEWALIKGKPYSRDRNNFIMFCKSCHVKYDGIGKGTWNNKKYWSNRNENA